MPNMQFPGMVPLQFAQSPGLPAQLAGLGGAFQKLAPKPAVPGAAPAGPAPMNISPAATNAGTNIPQQPGLMAALKGMTPQSILDTLRGMSAPGAAPQAGLPGSAALDSAGMLTPPVSASGIPLSMIPGG